MDDHKNISSGLFSEKVRNEIIDEFIYGHKKEYAQNLLKAKKLPSSYTKGKLVEKFQNHILENKITIEEIIEILDRIEEFGNQHVYLYKCGPNYVNKLRKEEYIRSILKENNLEELYNKSKIEWLPENPTLAAVRHNENGLKFKWVEKRLYKEKINEKIEEREVLSSPESSDEIRKTLSKVLTVEYLIQEKRSVCTLNIDFTTGNCELMLHKLPRGKYYEKQAEYWSYISKLLDSDSFELVGIKKSFSKLQDSKEVRMRKEIKDTIGGNKVAYTSSGKGNDLRTEETVIKSRELLKPSSEGSFGKYYWIEKDPFIKSEVSMTLYGEDNRVAFDGEHEEEEIMYVLSRIRNFSKK